MSQAEPDRRNDDAPDFGQATDFYTFAPESLAQLLPAFEIVREVGKGSMGIVYEARRREDASRVALKVLPPSLTLTERALARFLREGELMSRMRHPSIVGVLEFGTKARLHFFVMEFVDGVTLDERLRVGPLPVRQVAQLGLEVARALQFAHDNGIVHRDVKPGNLILRQQPRQGSAVAITDFGLARETGTGSMTESGAIVGTPMFMAPEQVLGDRDAIGAKMDVYGLGATLYTLLTGHVPFGGPTAQSVLKQVLDTEPVRPRTVRGDTPPALEAIILTAMEKDPARRYGTAGDMADDLQRFLVGERVQARLPGPSVRAVRAVVQRPVTIALTVLVLLLAVLAFALRAQSHASGLERELAEAESKLTRATLGLDDQLRPITTEAREQLLHQAEMHASDVLASDPSFGRAWFVRAKARHRLGSWSDALRDFDRFAVTEGATPELLTYRIDTLSRLTDDTARKRLLDDLNALLSQDDGPAACGLVATQLLAIAATTQVPRRNDLLAIADRVIGRIPADSSEASVLRARQHELEGSTDLAIREMRAAVETWRGDVTVHARAAEMFGRLGLEEASRREMAIVRRAGGFGSQRDPTSEAESGTDATADDGQPIDFGALRSFLDDLEDVLQKVDGETADGQPGGDAAEEKPDRVEHSGG